MSKSPRVVPGGSSPTRYSNPVFKPIQLQNAFVAYRITDATGILMKPEFTEWWKLG